MPQVYNPILRAFGQFRAAVLSSSNVARSEVRPATPLDTLLAPEERREVWERLRRQGLDPPPLELPPEEWRSWALAVTRDAVTLALSLRAWSALFLAIPLGLAAYWASRPQALEIPLGLRTVGELVLYMTSFPDHKGSGYRWTRNEIATKVRLILAESLGLSLDEVRPEKTLAELGAE